MADCIVKIIGKNGMSDSFTLSGISQSSGIQEIINALSESELREIESFVEDPGTKRKSIELNDSQSEYARQVIGNYNANSIESKLKQDNKSFKGFSQYTKSLLNAVKQMMGDVDFILFSNLDYSSSNAASDIQGAVLRYSRENPLLLIKGEDPDAIENTLRHELTHLFFNRLIETDKSLQESINKMYREISKRAKNLDDNPEIRDFIATIDTLNLLNAKGYVPTEIFAYLFQDENSYKYIKDNFLDVWNQFNDLIELREPVGPIKNNTVIGISDKVIDINNKTKQFNNPQDSTFYEVSSKGDKRFSALHAKFAPGTIIDGHDVGGRTIESVYQHGIKQNDWITDNNSKTGAPGPLSKLYKPSKEPIKNAIFNKELIKLGRVKVLKSTEKIEEVDRQRQKESGKISRISRQYTVFNTLIPIVGLKNYNSINELDHLKVSSELKSKWIKLIDDAKNGIGVLAAESSLTLKKSEYLNIDPKKAAKEFYNLQLEHTRLLKETALEIWGVEPEYTTTNNIFDDKLIEDNNEKYYIQSKDELENFSYEVGYLPLWEEWAKQNPELIEDLRIKSKGKILKDRFANTMVNQARALTDIIKLKEPVGPIKNDIGVTSVSPELDDDFWEALLNKANLPLKTAFSEQTEQPDFFEHSNEIPFQILEETQDFDKMMPHLKWDSEEKTFDNINDAYEFFESYKNDDVGLANVWSQAEEVTNITQIANAKAGDILRISSLEYLPVPKNGEVGLFGPAEWYGKMIPRKEMIRRINQNLSDLEAYRQKLEEDIKNRNNRTTDARYIIPKLTDELFNSIVNKQIKAKSKYYEYDSKTNTWGDLTEDGKRYLNLQPNYILARVFYDNKNNVYKGYIAHKFKSSEEASCMLIDLDPSYVQSIRRMDDSFRQEYEYKDGELVRDSKGNPKIKKKSARYDISKVSEEDIEAAQAGLVALNNIIEDLDVEIEAVKESPELLEKYTFKNGNSIYKASKHGILISGFFGDLGDALKEASVGDYVKVLESRNRDKSTNMTWATKVMDLPGGILVMMPSGKYKVVNENNATAVVFSKENLNKYLEDVVEIVDETKQMSRQKRLFSSSNNSKDFSIYPFWAESDASKRADLAKTLKKGDYVKIMFQGKEPNPIEFVAPILFVTQTKIYYGTSNGEIASVDLESYTEGKWVKEDNKWTFTGKVTKSFIRAAYVDHRKHKDALNYFTEYLESANELRELPWTKEDHEYVTLDNLTDQLLGVIDNPHSNLQKTSISSEWAITEFEDSDINTKVRKVSNLIVGDLVKVAYEHTNTNNTTETRYKWGMVVGKDGKTNEPITAIYGKGGKVIVRRQSYDRIHSVGERSLPIYLNKETGDYSNYQKEGFEEISKGRPNNLNKLREKYSEFFETGLKLVNVSKEELEEMRAKLDRNFGEKWEAVEMTYVKIDGGDKTWVMDFNEEKHTKIETDEVKYRIVANTFSDKRYSIRQYQINKNTAKLYNSYKATFDQIKSVVTLGDVITYEVTTSKGNKMYVPGIVTEITNSAIQISAVRVEADENTGERRYSNDTYTWFKNSKKQNIRVTEFYGSNYNDIYDLGRDLSSKNNKSLDTNKFKKSYDNRETISLMSERLQKLYGVNAILLNNEEMIEKGRELNSDFSNVRGFAIGSKNEIYINIDKASIAEPLHELSHLLMPGLKSKNPKAYNVMMDKVKDHPSYSDIAENYPELTGRDLDEEIFVTIFAEYFREKMLSEEKNEWLSGEFFELADNVPSVTSNLFDNNVDADSNDLMNMTLEDIMNNFGSAMVTGRLQPLIHTSINLNGSTDVQKIYKSLIDKGKLKKIC